MLNSTLYTTMSISLLSNAYLDENSARIRSKPVPWEVLAFPPRHTPYLPTNPFCRVINVQNSSLKRSWPSSRKLTANRKPKSKPCSYQKVEHTPCYTLVSSRNCNGSILYNAFSSWLRMHYKVFSAHIPFSCPRLIQFKTTTNVSHSSWEQQKRIQIFHTFLCFGAYFVKLKSFFNYTLTPP